MKMSGFNSGKASDLINKSEKNSKNEAGDEDVFDLK
jgi:hypothetical protein